MEGEGSYIDKNISIKKYFYFFLFFLLKTIAIRLLLWYNVVKNKEGEQKNMKTYTISQCARLLAQNNIDQPKAKYSNNVILAMLSTFDDNATVCVEPTRKGFELNRGSLVENLVKMALLDTDNGFKTAQRKSDIGRNAKNATAYGLNKNLKYEVKFATTFAPATESKPKTKYVILVTATGCYLIETANHQGRYTNNSDLDGTRLDELSARLGF